MYTQTELSAMTVADLRVIAEGKGVQGFASMTKADLVTSILSVGTETKVPVVVPREEVAKVDVITDVNDVASPTISATDREAAVRENIRQAMADKVMGINTVNHYPSPYGDL